MHLKKKTIRSNYTSICTIGIKCAFKLKLLIIDETVIISADTHLILMN